MEPRVELLALCPSGANVRIKVWVSWGFRYRRRPGENNLNSAGNGRHQWQESFLCRQLQLQFVFSMRNQNTIRFAHDSEDTPSPRDREELRVLVAARVENLGEIGQ